MVDKFALRVETLPALIGPARANTIPGRHTSYGVAADRSDWLKEGFLRVPAGDARRVTLIFHSNTLPANPPFTEDAGTRRYPVLRATLTVADTKGNSEVAHFDLEEG